MKHRDGALDMMAVSSHCSRFSRRHDMSIFNMGDYQSCENCAHMGQDNRCIAEGKQQYETGTILDAGNRVQL